MEPISKSVAAEANEELCREVSGKEIKEAAFQLGAIKAPRVDGYPDTFYQFYWEIVRLELIRVIQGFFGTSYMPHNLNYIDIALVPTTSDPETPAQFRPISLCNVLYKIPHSFLISSQSAFISGRAIQENIIVAHEAFHHLGAKKKGKRVECALQIDMSKAYDKIEWAFLERVMLKRDSMSTGCHGY